MKATLTDGTVLEGTVAEVVAAIQMLQPPCANLQPDQLQCWFAEADKPGASSFLDQSSETFAQVKTMPDDTYICATLPIVEEVEQTTTATADLDLLPIVAGDPPLNQEMSLVVPVGASPDATARTHIHKHTTCTRARTHTASSLKLGRGR